MVFVSQTVIYSHDAMPIFWQTVAPNSPTIPEIMSTKQLQALAIAHISLAKSELSDDDFSKLDIPALQKYVLLVSECLPLDYLGDQTLIRHAVEKLTQGHSVEEVVMLNFLLYISHLMHHSSKHPLERGIIRQKILGVLPKFELAVNKGLIHPHIYDKNADALAHIADYSGDVPAILDAIMEEYQRLQR